MNSGVCAFTGCAQTTVNYLARPTRSLACVYSRHLVYTKYSATPLSKSKGPVVGGLLRLGLATYGYRDRLRDGHAAAGLHGHALHCRAELLHLNLGKLHSIDRHRVGDRDRGGALRKGRRREAIRVGWWSCALHHCRLVPAPVNRVDKTRDKAEGHQAENRKDREEARTAAAALHVIGGRRWRWARRRNNAIAVAAVKSARRIIAATIANRITTVRRAS